MKKIIFKLVAFLGGIVLILVSYFSQPSAEINKSANIVTTPVPDSQFIIGAFHNGIDNDYQYSSQLMFNTWHQYTGPTWGWHDNSNDHYDIDTSLYKTFVTGIIDRNNTQEGMRTFMDRPVLEYLIGGQRSDYQCESISASYLANPYWFYAYNTSLIVNNNVDYSVSDITDNTYGTGERVKHCHLSNQNPFEGDLLINSGLRANREMSFNQVNGWMKDTTYEWYVLPRIRIDSAYAANVNNNNNIVCKIVVTGWEGETEKEYDLTVQNFKQYPGSNYNGNYFESFYFTDGGPLEYLTIEQSKMRNFIDTNVFIFDWTKYCGCDIKIYWTGACDIWVDRIRLENLPAHQYLTLQESRWISKVNSEVYWAGRNYNASKPIPNYFYFEEAEFNHFPVIAELNKQIMSASGNNNTLIIWLNYDLFKANVPDCWNYQFTSDMLKKYLYDDYGLRNIVMGAYALEGWKDEEGKGLHRKSWHPSTLSDSSYSKATGILSYKTTPSDYDNKLQQKIDDKVNLSGVNLGYIDKLMFDLSKVPGMRIINCPQAHLWHNTGHKLKEPSNEELSLQANLALTYNAKGIIWFAYVCDWTTIGDDFYARGIMDNGLVPRTNSVYGQNKFEGIDSINIKLTKWGPKLMKYDPQNAHSYIYHNSTERASMQSSTYFNQFVTLRPAPIGLTVDCNDDFIPTDISSGWINDCQDATYL